MNCKKSNFGELGKYLKWQKGTKKCLEKLLVDTFMSLLMGVSFSTPVET
jgi:hypothetical protein